MGVLTIHELVLHAIAILPQMPHSIIFLDVCYAGMHATNNPENKQPVAGVNGLATWIVAGHTILAHIDDPYDFHNNEYSTDRLVDWMNLMWY